MTVEVRVNTMVRSENLSEAIRKKTGAASESGKGFEKGLKRI